MHLDESGLILNNSEKSGKTGKNPDKSGKSGKIQTNLNRPKRKENQLIPKPTTTRIMKLLPIFHVLDFADFIFS